MSFKMALDLDSGISLSEAYFKIVEICFQYKDVKEAKVSLSVFKDKTAFDNGKSEISTMKHVCDSTCFDTYFSDTILAQQDKTVLSQAILWLLSLDIYDEAVEI